MLAKIDEAFTLGMFAGELLMKGIIIPDLQRDNIGIRGKMPVLLDFTDSIRVNLPEDLTKDIIRKMKESIFSLADSYSGSFIENSFLRAGFISRTGILGHMIYEDARNNKYSSFLYADKSLIDIKHSLYRITRFENVKAIIGEWMNVPLSLWERAYEDDSSSVNNTELQWPLNKYYLKNSLFIWVVYSAKENMNKTEKAFLYIDMALAALQFGMPYMSYGLLRRCSLFTDNENIKLMCEATINELLSVTEEYKHVVEKNIELDDMSYIWLLEDLDITVLQDNSCLPPLKF